MDTTSALKTYRLSAGRSLESIGADIGVNKSTILRWEETRIPAERVLDVERVTNIPRQLLRPDLYASSALNMPAPAAPQNPNQPEVLA